MIPILNRKPSGNGKCLLNMKLSLFSVISDSSVIINTVGHIGILLDLRKQDALANRMNSSGFYKEGISLFNRNAVQNLCQGIVIDSPPELFSADLLLESIVEKSSGLRIHDIPHFCLPVLSLIFQGKAIIRMDLDGEILIRIDKFDENRKLPEAAAVGSQNPSTFFFDIFLQCLPGIFPIEDDGWAIRMTGKLPCLCRRFSVIFLSIFFHQPAAAPQIILAGRF